MKVTVAFGLVRVVVPCGDGDLLISELIQKALPRYRKATGKSSADWVVVHNLKNSTDEGILDPGDRVRDVTDDREQIIAIFEELRTGTPVFHQHNGGDGTSGSSHGTDSPDLFRDLADDDGADVIVNKHDVIVTRADILAESQLTVRRGSESAINSLSSMRLLPIQNERYHGNGRSDIKKTNQPLQDRSEIGRGAMQLRRRSEDSNWSTEDEARRVTVSSRQRHVDENHLKNIEHLKPLPGCQDGKSHQTTVAQPTLQGPSTFVKTSSCAKDVIMHRWLAAQKQAQVVLIESKNRREPLGSSDELVVCKDLPSATQASVEPIGVLVDICNITGSLGLHVLPAYDAAGRSSGLVIQTVEPHGRADLDGRLQANDRIVEINGTSLIDVDFERSKEIFKEAVKSGNLQLCIVQLHSQLASSPASLCPQTLADIGARSAAQGAETDRNMIVGCATAQVADGGVNSIEHYSQTMNLFTDVFQMNDMIQDIDSVAVESSSQAQGNKIAIQLSKGPTGLGFSITTRDNPAGGKCPIYIKNILPRGSAIENGQLIVGDRLLQVNDVELTGMSQSEVAALLRSIPCGTLVNLVAVRSTSSHDLQADHKIIGASNGVVSVAIDGIDDNELCDTEILTFNIRLNETGSAGLGVSIRGKAVSLSPTLDGDSPTKDLGIYIKSIMVGGAAAKDGRLQVDDRLVEVNGEFLLNKCNFDAMASLRLAMQKESHIPGYICVRAARRKESTGTVKRRLGITTREVRVSQSEVNDELPLNRSKAGCINDRVLTENNEESHPITTSELEQTGIEFNSEIIIDRVKMLPIVGGDGEVLQAIQAETNHCIQSGTEQTCLKQEGSRDLHGSPQQTDSQTSIVQSSSQVKYAEIMEDSNTNRNEQDMRTSDVDGAPMPPDWLLESDNKNSEDDDSSKRSPEIDAKLTFHREGFGRQSMSEKRKGHLDPRQSELYQKIKQNKGRQYCTVSLDRNKNTVARNEKDSLLSPSEKVGPTLGLKKSTSLESLQTAVLAQELKAPDYNKDEEEVESDNEGEEVEHLDGPVRGGFNSSFRAAIDRSYDMKLSQENMQLNLAQVENSCSVKEAVQELIRKPKVFPDCRQDSTLDDTCADTAKKLKKEKSRSLFKGFGQMLGFGKNRKSDVLKIKQQNAFNTAKEIGKENVPADSKIQVEIKTQPLRASKTVESQPTVSRSTPVQQINSEKNPLDLTMTGIESSLGQQGETDISCTSYHQDVIPANLSSPLQQIIPSNLSSKTKSPEHKEKKAASKLRIPSPTVTGKPSVLLKTRPEEPLVKMASSTLPPRKAIVMEHSEQVRCLQNERYSRDDRMQNIYTEHPSRSVDNNAACYTSKGEDHFRLNIPAGIPCTASKRRTEKEEIEAVSHYQNIEMIQAQLRRNDYYQQQYRVMQRKPLRCAGEMEYDQCRRDDDELEQDRYDARRTSGRVIIVDPRPTPQRYVEVATMKDYIYTGDQNIYDYPCRQSVHDRQQYEQPLYDTRPHTISYEDHRRTEQSHTPMHHESRAVQSSPNHQHSRSVPVISSNPHSVNRKALPMCYRTVEQARVPEAHYHPSMSVEQYYHQAGFVSNLQAPQYRDLYQRERELVHIRPSSTIPEDNRTGWNNSRVPPERQLPVPYPYHNIPQDVVTYHPNSVASNRPITHLASKSMISCPSMTDRLSHSNHRFVSSPPRHFVASTRNKPNNDLSPAGHEVGVSPGVHERSKSALDYRTSARTIASRGQKDVAVRAAPF